MQPVKTKKKLSRADKKQIEAAIARANRTDKKGKSAQDSIPYERMWPDGICRVSDSHYTKTIQFQDINYQLSQNEDKTAIFEGWCDFLNYFDSSIHFQLSFLNLAASEETFANSISIPPQRDAFDSIREEYTTMLQNQLARGNNGLIKTKYLTFGINADSIKAAKPRLERIETDILNNFKRLGVAARTLDGKERLSQLHAVFHMDEQLPFQFEWDWLAPSGLSTKDFIAPSSFEFRTGKQFRMGKKYGAVSFLQILAPELNDRLLADFLDMESSLIVSMHIQSVDQVKAIKTVKRKITDLDRSKIEEQKKAVRAGYDMDIIPSDLATYGSEAKKLLQDLQSRNERMFLLTFLVLNTADNPRQLGNNIFQAGSIAQKYNCQLTRLDFQQEEGLMSCLPLGLNQIEIQRGLTTSSTAIFVPFTTQELFQNGKEALYYGINALSNNLIMVDREGIICEGDNYLNEAHAEMAKVTNKNKLHGSLADALKGADAFVGVSKPKLVTAEMVKSMNDKPILFAMANPTPEIMPDEAKAAGAFIVGTGRSDFPNQINNVIAFPGIFKGALAVRASDINEEMKMAAAKAIYTSLTGFSPLMAEEVCCRAGIDGGFAVNALEENAKLHLFRTFSYLIEDIKNGAFTPNIVYQGDEPKEFSALKLTQYQDLREETYDSISGVLETYYAMKNRITRIRQKSSDLRRVVNTALERNVKKYDLQQKQLKDTDKREKYRIYGELLNTYGYSCQPGDTSLKAVNYYNGEEITIPLDGTLSAGENAKKYFDRYGKLKRTREALEELLVETKEEIDHLESISTALDIALDEADLVQLKEELIEYGYIRRKGPTGKKQKITSHPFHYRSSEGFDIYVGKNNFQNEELSFKFASGNDWWFHAKGQPGSHVIVKTNGKELPDSVYEEAAALAAYYSKGRQAPKVEIDYTLKKNLRKPNGSKPGFVVYYTNYSMMAEPNIRNLQEIQD